MTRHGNKERIVDVAIALFNERGTPAVSTNHIAETAGLSPGNLYYHFRNKEEIVRAAYERALAAYDAVWADAAAAAPSPDAMRELLEATFDAQWRFRFFQRELPWLVQRDEVLRIRYREVQERRLTFYRELVGSWIEAGLATPVEGTDIDDLVLASWVVGDQWLAYLEAMGGGADERQVRRGADLIFAVFRPHLAPEVAQRVARS